MKNNNQTNTIHFCFEKWKNQVLIKREHGGEPYIAKILSDIGEDIDDQISYKVFWDIETLNGGLNHGN